MSSKHYYGHSQHPVTASRTQTGIDRLSPLMGHEPAVKVQITITKGLYYPRS
jgi:hypothetical protein